MSAIVKGARVRIVTGPARGREGVVYDTHDVGDEREVKVQLDGDAAGAWWDRKNVAPSDVARLEARVTELQARGTELENQQRMWRARAEASAEILRVVLIEVPTLQRMAGHGCTEGEIRNLVSSLTTLHARIDLLERDAWTKCAALARGFVEAIDRADSAQATISAETADMEVAAIARLYIDRFREALA